MALVIVLSAAPAAFAAHPVPFNGSGTGTFSATTTAVTVTGTGHFEHLGLTTVSATGVVTGVTSCGGFTSVEQDAYNAANGDALTLEVSNVYCAASGSGTYQVTGSFTIVGGTGRFADATGSGTISGTAVFLTPTTGTFSETATDTISY